MVFQKTDGGEGFDENKDATLPQVQLGGLSIHLDEFSQNLKHLFLYRILFMDIISTPPRQH